MPKFVDRIPCKKVLTPFVSLMQSDYFPRKSRMPSENYLALFLIRIFDYFCVLRYYYNDETHIQALLEANVLVTKGGAALATAAVRGLILIVSHKKQIVELYP